MKTLDEGCTTRKETPQGARFAHSSRWAALDESASLWSAVIHHRFCFSFAEGRTSKAKNKSGDESPHSKGA
jgi:hypothetical protein